MSDRRRSRLAEIARKNTEEDGSPAGSTNTEGRKAAHNAASTSGFGWSVNDFSLNKSASEASGVGLGDDVLASMLGQGNAGGGGMNRSPYKAAITGAAAISGLSAPKDYVPIQVERQEDAAGADSASPIKPSSRGRRKRPSVLDSILAETEVETPQIAALSRPVSRGPREHRIASVVDSTELARINEEREQLHKTMLDLQREKMAIINIASAEIEKQKVFEEEAKLALNERDELRATLSALRAKNTWLSKTMEMKEMDAQEQRDHERDALASKLQSMETMNKLLTKKVLEAQEEAERKLEKEKEGFREALRAMEAEKLQLAQRVLLTETQARKEAMTVAQQRDDFHKRVEIMKQEQAELLLKVRENEELTKNASTALAGKLAQERSDLEDRMRKMEEEKKSIANALKEMESMSSAQAAVLEQKLDREKEELRVMIERMENEKTSLAQNLSNAELDAQKHAQQVAEQLAKEKEALQSTLKKMEEEKRELAERLSRNEQQVEVHAQQFSSAAEELSKERLAMRREMELMQKERLLLQEEMKKQQERIADEEKKKEEKLARERDELKSAVARMKQELDLEKQQQTMLFEAAFNDDNIVDYVEPTASPSLVSKKSLFDVMSSDAEAAATSFAPMLERSKSKLTHHGREIDTIKEAPNESDEEADAINKGVTINSQTNDPIASGSEPNPTTEPPRRKMTKKASNAIIGKQNFDLPAPHTAASNGDTDELKKLWEMEETLLSSFDGFGRTPLFYAAAHDQHEAASFLVEVAPDAIFVTDVHGDGPIHAAASGGSGRCIELLVRVGQPRTKKKVVDMANNMGMVPAHLAKNAMAMEALFHHEANFQARDISNRTPLFICAALNRSECVQFIIDNCIDGDEDALYAADSRGDTPLHAAACNGAADCLLLLLQCGINPMIENKAKLRPIDLAIKNKKNKCRELLAQYHLHFATASDFDSVGFIATLEVINAHYVVHLYFSSLIMIDVLGS
jgi:ankyrin repeat protein